MNMIRQKITDAAVGVGVADTPEGLAAIHKPGCAATIWRRQLPAEVQTWLDGLDPDHLPRVRMVLPSDDVVVAVREHCDAAGLAPSAARNWFETDITDLASRFAALMDAPYLRLRIDRVTTNACRKFHIDAIRARLICTYRGSGTQYGISVDGDMPTRVFQVATGAPMILRGTRWPEHPRSGLLHRSPPIEGTGETRCVLVLDPVMDPETGD